MPGKMIKRIIDLNCNMGGGLGVYKLGCDEEIIKYISSSNIAYGFRTGSRDDEENHNSSQKTCHGFCDLVGFSHEVQ